MSTLIIACFSFIYAGFEHLNTFRPKRILVKAAQSSAARLH